MLLGLYTYRCATIVHACAYAGPLSHELYRCEIEKYTKHCNVNKMADSRAGLVPVSV